MIQDEKVESVAIARPRRADVAPRASVQPGEAQRLIEECAVSYRAELVPLPRGLVLEEWAGLYCEQFLG